MSKIQRMRKWSIRAEVAEQLHHALLSPEPPRGGQLYGESVLGAIMAVDDQSLEAEALPSAQLKFGPKLCDAAELSIVVDML